MNARHSATRSHLDRLRSAAERIGRPVTFMEVCGTHTMSAFRSGLHSVMPASVTLLSGPGCPVCVTAQGDIDQLIELATDHDVTLCTYGDMMRVPGHRGSLESARSRGADVRVVYSTLDAVRIAAQEPTRQVVFGAVGFETTAPATAAAVLEACRQGLVNFSALASHKRVVPAMLALLEDRTAGPPRLDGFLCPGHVSVVIGSDAYRPIVERHGLPCVIGGFEPALMAAALACLAELVRDGRAELVNLYPEAVTPRGNEAAQRLLGEVFEPADVRWRGLGVIPRSGLGFRPKYESYDAARRFALPAREDHEPKGCICGRVISGHATPPDCRLFATACTPIRPIGPCMVSSEGTCQAWLRYGQYQTNRTASAPRATRSRRAAAHRPRRAHR